MKYFNTLLYLLIFSSVSLAQSDDEVVKKIYDEALNEGESYQMLEFLSTEIGHRLSGSPQAAAAVDWTKQIMEMYGFDTVYLQPVMVPHWVRGNIETGKIISRRIGTEIVNICALGNSVGTGPGGLTAEVIEVKDFQQLKELGASKVQGKIVFFNRAMDPSKINTFAAYGGAVNQRGQGAIQAVKYGAEGVIVRSMTLASDDVPHTGATNYSPGEPQIPAVAISTNDADLLSSLLSEEGDLKFYIETDCQMLPDVLSYNVIGELKGSQNPDQYIITGGHLDSWDVGDGSHDDGAGCIQSIEALRILKTIGIRPNHSIRAVMFMNEENGLRGGRKYAEIADQQNENHMAAIESDRGGFVPRGFTISTSDKNFEKISGWKSLFTPYEADNIYRGGGGADIGPLRSQNTTLIGLYPDSQRYFDYHHSANDTFDKINKRELELGSAAIASLIYLIDKYGLEKDN